jgi:deferrochelatase/peroxidase EfeB
MSGCPFSRRQFLTTGSLGLLATKVLGAGPGQAAVPLEGATGTAAAVPFYGRHQAGIVTPQQRHTYLAVFDVVTTSREEVARMLRDWTVARGRMALGHPPASPVSDLSVPGGDTGEAAGLPPSRLTVTFGFGPGLFTKDGRDRFGLAARRPAELVDLPKFHGDYLIEAKTGGDLSVQACADDPQVAFHAVRNLNRLGDGVVQLRWTQAGFVSGDGHSTPRNLMGFRDGTQRPPDADQDRVVWAAGEGAGWMRDGTFLVVRRIRMGLEHWDQTETDYQEQLIGRRKDSGAPLSSRGEFDPLDLAATGPDGSLAIPEHAHVRVATAATNDGAQILRRGYAFNDGTSLTTEPWPPWNQRIDYDAGLLFLAYQHDPRAGFVKIFEQMSRVDALNKFLIHTGSGIFACPPGPREGEFIGQALFA